MDLKKEQFLNPLAPYRGELRPQTLIFNANLQEFAQKVGFISGLHTAGKITSADAQQRLSQLWSHLEASGVEMLRTKPQQ